MGGQKRAAARLSCRGSPERRVSKGREQQQRKHPHRASPSSMGVCSSSEDIYVKEELMLRRNEEEKFQELWNSGDHVIKLTLRGGGNFQGVTEQSGPNAS